MASDLSPIMLDKLRKHFETGVPIERMTFTDEQKKRIQMCIEGYKRFATDPNVDIYSYMRNRFNRTYSELRNDIKLIDYIASFFEEGQKNISKMRVRNASRVLMKNGQDTGNMKALHDGASLLMKLDRLDEPDSPEQMDENLARMPIVVTTDVSKKFANKRGHNEEEMRKIRHKWGVKQDSWQQMMEERSEIQDVEEIPAETERIADELADSDIDEAKAADLLPPDDADENPTDDDATDDDATDDFDAEIEAIIAADKKAHEERMKKK